MGTAANGGRGFKGRAGVRGERPARCTQQRNQASCRVSSHAPAHTRAAGSEWSPREAVRRATNGTPRAHGPPGRRTGPDRGL